MGGRSKTEYRFVKDPTYPLGIRRVGVVLEAVCPNCGKIFLKKGHGSKFCCKFCYYEMRTGGVYKKVDWTPELREKMSRKYMGKGNPMYGKPSWSRGKRRPEISGDKHPLWKGGFYYSEDGYKMLGTGNAKEAEHRRVMEGFLGRKLAPDEVVHHMNKIRDDNRIENLQVMTRAEHMNLHRTDIQASRQKGKTNEETENEVTQ